MKRLVAVAAGIMLAGLTFGTAAAAGNGSSPASANDTAEVESSVSQTQIDTVGKREMLRQQRDEKMKVRERNLDSTQTNNSSLFKSSK